MNGNTQLGQWRFMEFVALLDITRLGSKLDLRLIDYVWLVLSLYRSRCEIKSTGGSSKDAAYHITIWLPRYIPQL